MSTSQYGIIVAGCVSERLDNENLDPGIGDSDWLEILHPESLETIHSIESNPYKPTHNTIDINDPVCKASNPDIITVTAITNVENQQTIPELITAPTSTPEPITTPEPGSWKGAMGRIKTTIPDHWEKVYTFISTGKNPLLEATGKAFKVIDNYPTWKSNALAPDGGGWVFLGTVEGIPNAKSIPMDCIEFLDNVA
jgi:hypothetical protein